MATLGGDMLSLSFAAEGSVGVGEGAAVVLGAVEGAADVPGFEVFRVAAFGFSSAKLSFWRLVGKHICRGALPFR
jgi:hypothetical protein